MLGSSNTGPPAGASGKNTDAFNFTREVGQMSDSEAARLARLISQRSMSPDINLDNHKAIIEENLRRLERNLAKAQLHDSPNYVEVPSDDEELLKEPILESSTLFTQTALGWKMMKAVTFLKTLTPMRKIVEKLAGEDTRTSGQEQPSADLLSSVEAKVFTSTNTILAQGMEDLLEIPQPLLNLARAKVYIPLTLLTNAALWRMHEDPSCIKLKKGLILNDPKMIVMDTSSGLPPE